MGMDLISLNPNAPVGEYFRRNVWGWHPLWNYCCSVSSLARQVKYGHSNDGDGLEAAEARSLAKTLHDELENGRTSQYIAQREKTLADLPDEPCQWCTDGSRTPNNGAESIQCHMCKGTGKVRPRETHYYLGEQDVRDLAEFLKHCGGFEIW